MRVVIHLKKQAITLLMILTSWVFGLNGPFTIGKGYRPMPPCAVRAGCHMGRYPLLYLFALLIVW